MPVDKAQLDAWLGEVAGDDTELRGLLAERFAKNDAAATRAVGGHMRTADYTRKTQELATEKQRIQSVVGEYEKRLTAAEDEKKTIMQDLADRNISVAQATAAIEEIQRVYELKDEDLPFKKGDLIKTASKGKVTDTTPDITDRLKSFKDELLAEVRRTNAEQLIPQLGSMLDMDIIWADIADEHRELFGKRLTGAERAELLKIARAANNGKGAPVQSVWEEKYGVRAKRAETEDASKRDTWRKEWEKEQADKRSREALDGMRPDSFAPGEEQHATLFKRPFAEMPEPGKRTEDASKFTPRRSDADQERGGAAERAKQKWVDRRSRGIPLGQPEPAKVA